MEKSNENNKYKEFMESIANSELAKIHETIISLSHKSKMNWVELYKSIKLCENNEYYKINGSFSNLSAWVSFLGKQCNIQDSALWRSRKASDIYLTKYVPYKQQMKESYKEIDDIANVSPESIEYAYKIANENIELLALWIDRIVFDKATREDLRQAYKLEKRNKMNTNNKSIDTNIEVHMLSDILMLLSRPEGLVKAGIVDSYDIEKNRYRSTYFSRKYVSLSDFPISDGNLHIDLLAIENVYLDDISLKLHGFDIRLNGFSNLDEYLKELQTKVKCVDYFYVILNMKDANNPDLCSLFQKYNVGIIKYECISDKALQIITKPYVLNSTKRYETLERALLKYMK